MEWIWIGVGLIVFIFFIIILVLLLRTSTSTPIVITPTPTPAPTTTTTTVTNGTTIGSQSSGTIRPAIGRYVTVQSIKGNPLKMYRIEIYDNNGLMIQRYATISSSSPAAIGTDPLNVIKTHADDTYYASLPSLDNGYIKLVFPTDKLISMIILYVVPGDTVTSLMNGVTVSILDSSNQTVFQSNPINYYAPFYIYTGPFNYDHQSDLTMNLNKALLPTSNYSINSISGISNATLVAQSNIKEMYQPCIQECLRDPNCMGVSFDRINYATNKPDPTVPLYNTCSFKTNVDIVGHSDPSATSIVYDLSKIKSGYNVSFNASDNPAPKLINTIKPITGTTTCDYYCQNNVNSEITSINSNYTSAICTASSSGTCSSNTANRTCTCLAFSSGGKF